MGINSLMLLASTADEIASKKQFNQKTNTVEANETAIAIATSNGVDLAIADEDSLRFLAYITYLVNNNENSVNTPTSTFSTKTITENTNKKNAYQNLELLLQELEKPSPLPLSRSPSPVMSMSYDNNCFSSNVIVEEEEEAKLVDTKPHARTLSSLPSANNKTQRGSLPIKKRSPIIIFKNEKAAITDEKTTTSSSNSNSNLIEDEQPQPQPQQHKKKHPPKTDKTMLATATATATKKMKNKKRRMSRELALLAPHNKYGTNEDEQFNFDTIITSKEATLRRTSKRQRVAVSKM
mmetsp:Transcript_48630/g.54370  ORF Transcript_48630/g.54370 Transcript_48630/m.54370 type:complete len:294 (-) Transcript_48630:361-1242(-)